MSHIGKESWVEVSGQRYRLSRYTRELDAEFVKWALQQLPCPIAQARQDIEGFPAELQKIIVQEAIEAKRKREAGISDQIEDIRQSHKGLWKVLCLLFQRHHPELSERDVGKIFDECLDEHGPDYLADKIAEAQGIVKKSDLPPDDGKKKDGRPE